MTGFAEVAPGVHLLRHPVCDVNVTLVVGRAAALVVDTLSTASQASQLLVAVRAVTPLPLRVVNTHHHFDHCFGNATLAAPAWAHPETIELLAGQGERLRELWQREWLPIDPELAAGLGTVTIRPPEHPVDPVAILDLGDRVVTVRHLGPGHTGGDVVVEVPDASLVVAGDLVETSGPPQFDDAYLARWPETLTGLLAGLPPGATVVPGHGEPVDPTFVRAQRADLAAVSQLIADGHAAGAPAEAIVGHLVAYRPRAGQPTAFDPVTARVAVLRGLAELGARG